MSWRTRELRYFPEGLHSPHRRLWQCDQSVYVGFRMLTDLLDVNNVIVLCVQECSLVSFLHLQRTSRSFTTALLGHIVRSGIFGVPAVGVAFHGASTEFLHHIPDFTKTFE